MIKLPMEEAAAAAVKAIHTGITALHRILAELVLPAWAVVALVVVEDLQLIERFGRELCYERFGVSSGIALMRMLEGTVFHVRRPEALGDWRLYDARRAPPPADVAAPACTSAPSPPPANAASDDVMLFMNTIRPESIAALEATVMIDVLVGEIYSPSHFWVLRRDDQHCGLLYAVMDAMTEYYDNGLGAKRCLAEEMEARAGLYCAARYDRDWHRALVLHLIDADTALLRYIDYGTIGRMPITSLKPLLKCWGELPAQAVRARLAGVMPPSRARHWPHTSSAEFLQLVRDLPLVAEIVAVDYEEGILELFLVDTSTAEEMCVNDLLIQKGFAAERFDTVLGKIESYLRPTFAALEGGVTLSYADICNYIEHGINLSCIDSYRRHVLDEPAQRSPMPPLLTRAATVSPSCRSLSSVREESRFLTTLTCLVFGNLLPVNYAIAVEQARNKLNCQCEPDDAAVWLTAAECQHLERLRESNVASAAVYLDRLMRARLPPAADYPVSPPPNLLADAAFYSP
ncbi:Tudor domain-containing protein 5 [Eumeta japonica]|uniref:Tudor domain-containing protein 5 n=1 Tax=Eumeta variegata TaxID=151549 RepID=A0A4C1WVI1_EUMVA|nr:Tudor domain-containing protein 5 [Eumeta japonica]